MNIWLLSLQMLFDISGLSLPYSSKAGHYPSESADLRPSFPISDKRPIPYGGILYAKDSAPNLHLDVNLRFSCLM